MKWLQANTPPEIVAVIGDVLDGKLRLHKARPRRPAARTLKFAIQYAQYAMCDTRSDPEVRNLRRELHDTCDRLGIAHETRRVPSAARELVARMYGLKVRAMKESIYPQKGRGKRSI